MKKDCYTAWELYKWGGSLERAKEFALSLKYDGVYLILSEASHCTKYKAKDIAPSQKTQAWLKPYEDKALAMVCDWYESTENPVYMLAKLKVKGVQTEKVNGQWIEKPRLAK